MLILNIALTDITYYNTYTVVKYTGSNTSIQTIGDEQLLLNTGRCLFAAQYTSDD